MSVFNTPPVKKVIQVHPRVLVQEKNCCDCVYYESNQMNLPNHGECEVMNREVGAYDECGSFTRKSYL